MPELKPFITIALASYQGARYLPAQLESISRQTYQNWRLLISDDGSQDATLPIIDEFASAYPTDKVRLLKGPKQGATSNFLYLTENLGDTEWFAYCDQDDVWHPDKLARAASNLQNLNTATIYAARTTVCDHNLRILSPAPAYGRPLTFQNALIQACLPGNTIVGNREALQILQSALPAAQQASIKSHDWWVYQVMAGVGATLIRDPKQVLYYRQHDQNVMGRNDTLSAKAARLAMLCNGSYAGWLDRNVNALRPFEGLFLPENRQMLRRFSQALDRSGPATCAEFRRLGLYRQTRSGTAAIMAAAFAGRLGRRANGPSQPPDIP